MKYLPLLILCIVLVVCLLVAHRFREIPDSVMLYMGVLLSFHLVSVWGLQRDSVSSTAYVGVFSAFVFVSQLAAGYMALQLSSVLKGQVPLFCTSFMFALALFSTFCAEIGQSELYQSTKLILVEAAISVMMGAILLVSLAAHVSSLGVVLRLCLGGFMVFDGALRFAFAIGLTRNFSVWARLNTWLPAVPELVAFGLLAFYLGTAQLDMVHQESPAASIAQGQQVLADIGGE